MDCPGSLAHAEISKSALYIYSVLYCFGLPNNYAKLEG
jgi:hypothetical protein